jgi:hypothetical protein
MVLHQEPDLFVALPSLVAAAGAVLAWVAGWRVQAGRAAPMSQLVRV